MVGGYLETLLWLLVSRACKSTGLHWFAGRIAVSNSVLWKWFIIAQVHIHGQWIMANILPTVRLPGGCHSAAVPRVFPPSPALPVPPPYITPLSLTAQFEAVLLEQQQARSERDRLRMRMLTADPFDIEAQRLMAEEIRQSNIDANMEAAMEHSPESFGSVVMLYINCTVNGHPVKAFIDSGMSFGGGRRAGGGLRIEGR